MKAKEIQTALTTLTTSERQSKQVAEWRNKTNDAYEVSVYEGKKAVSEEESMSIGAHLASAFPQSVNKAWVAELSRLAIQERIPYDRMKDAVDWLILHHHYPSITIADVLDFDVKLKLYSYKDVLKMDGKFDEDTTRLYPRYCIKDGVALFISATELNALPEKWRTLVQERITKTNNQK